MKITISQIKAARALLGWSQEDLSKNSGVPVQILRNIEAGRKLSPTIYEWDAMTKSIEDSGIEFTQCEGVRRRQNLIKHYKGSEGFIDFFDLVYNQAKTVGGSFCIYNACPSKWEKLISDDWKKMHVKRMATVSDNINFKITCPYNERNLIGSPYATYKWIPKEKWTERSFYIFGDYVAILIFKEDTVEITLFKEKAVASTFLDLFNIAWETIAVIPDE